MQKFILILALLMFPETTSDTTFILPEDLFPETQPTHPLLPPFDPIDTLIYKLLDALETK